MKYKRIAALLLSAALLVTALCGCGAPDAEEIIQGIRSGSGSGESAAEAISSALEALTPDGSRFGGRPAVTVAPDGIHADVDYADMTWYIYDTVEFKRLAVRFTAASGDRAISLYESLLAEYAKVYTLNNLAYIDFYAHPNDEELRDACQQLDAALNEVFDIFYNALSAALDGPAGRTLEEYFGTETAESLRGYEEQTDRDREISDRLSALALEYNTLAMQPLSLDEETEKIGGIYREMIDLRNEQAQLYGYDSYAAYAYESSYGRDYTPEDAAALCEAVKPYAREYFSKLYYSEATYADYTVDTCFTEKELVGMIEHFMPQISDDAAEAAAYMRQHGLYFMDSLSRVADMGFTVTLDEYNAPFIYLALSGDEYDIESMFHEFGHYYDAYVNPVPDLLLSVGSLDIFEIHSTGMEALSTGWYEELYGEDADIARIRFLDSALYTVFSGCMFDEFQRIVYADPSLTPEQINETFVTVAESYGLSSYGRSFSHYWMQVSHNFESPFYYISYAVSMLASLQIYEMAEADWNTARDFYNRLVSLGAFDYTYCELLDEVGLESFTDGLPSCVPQAVNDLSALCTAWENAA